MRGLLGTIIVCLLVIIAMQQLYVELMRDHILALEENNHLHAAYQQQTMKLCGRVMEINSRYDGALRWVKTKLEIPDEQPRPNSHLSGMGPGAADDICERGEQTAGFARVASFP